MGGREDDASLEASSSGSSSDEVLLHGKHRKKLQEQLRQKRKRSGESSSGKAAARGPNDAKKREEKAMNPTNKMDLICGVCEKSSDDLYVCSGRCVSAFHLACLHITDRPSREKWMCPDCDKRQHVCFYCKQLGFAPEDGGKADDAEADGKTMRAVYKCRAVSCGKFYHQDCIIKLPLARIAGSHFVCPLHTCASCDDSGAQKESVRCARCPVAYHMSCIPRNGVVLLPGKRILCPKHHTILDEKSGEESTTVSTGDITGETTAVDTRHDTRHEDGEAEASGRHSKREKKKKKKRKKSKRERSEDANVRAEEEDARSEKSFARNEDVNEASSTPDPFSGLKEEGGDGQRQPSTKDSPQPESPPATISSMFGSPDPPKERIKAKLDEVLGQSDDDNDSDAAASGVKDEEEPKKAVDQFPDVESKSEEVKSSTIEAVAAEADHDRDRPSAPSDMNTVDANSLATVQSPVKMGTFGDLSVQIPETTSASRSSASSEEDESSRGSMSVRSRSGNRAGDLTKERGARSKKKKLKRTKSGDLKKNDSTDANAHEDTEDSPAVSKVKSIWVQCDNCKKWRIVPSDVDLDSMPEKWYCRMNTWNHLYSSCDMPQEIEEKRKEDDVDSADDQSPPAPKKLKVTHSRQSTEDANSEGAGSTTEAGMSKASKKQDKEVKKRKLKQKLKEKYGEVKWVQCENTQCGKWRVVPSSVDISRLPSVWYCNLNTWAPELASCSAPNPPEVEIYLQRSQAKKQTPGRLSKKQKTGESTPSGGGGTNTPSEPRTSKSTKGPRSTPSHSTPSTSSTVFPSSDASQVRGKVDPSKHAVLEWAQCEKCNKWRKLPQHIKSSTLPDKWYCSMNTWDPARASCSAPQEKDQEPVPIHGSRKHGKLSFAEMLFASTGQLRKTYTPESSMLSFEYEGVMYHRDDQYKHSSMYVVPPHALKRTASTQRRPNSTGPAVDSPAYHKLVAEIADAILKVLDLRTTHSVSDIVDTISATRHSNCALSLGVITAAIAMLSNKGLIEKVDRRSNDPNGTDEDAHKGRSALSRLALYRKVPKRPLKALKAWKIDAAAFDHAR